MSGPGVTMRYRLVATRGCRCKWGFFGVVFHAEVDPSTVSVFLKSQDLKESDRALAKWEADAGTVQFGKIFHNSCRSKLCLSEVLN